MQHLSKCLVFALCFILSACNQPKLTPIDLPEELEPVAQGFVDALANGDIKSARKYVAPSSRIYFDEDFTGPNAFKPAKGMKPVKLRDSGMLKDGDINNPSILFAIQQDGKWQTMELQLYWLDNEKVEIDEWQFSDFGPAPAEIKMQQTAMQYFPWLLLAMAVLGLFTLAFIVWFVKRKPELIAPPTRRSREIPASTRSSNDDTAD